MELERKTLEGVVQNKVKAITVLIVGKGVPTVVAPKDNMVDGSGYVDPFIACHPERIAELSSYQCPIDHPVNNKLSRTSDVGRYF